MRKLVKDPLVIFIIAWTAICFAMCLAIVVLVRAGYGIVVGGILMIIIIIIALREN